MVKSVHIFFGVLLVCFSSCTFESGKEKTENAIQRLKKGNERFAQKQAQLAKHNQSRTKNLCPNAKPFAIVITCSYSCFSPHVIFDQNPEDLFVIRTASGVICKSQMDTVRFGITNFSPSVIIILGHEKCPVVNAVIKGKGKHIPIIENHVTKAITRAKALGSENLLEESIKQHALAIKQQIEKDPVIQKKIEKNHTTLHAAYFNTKEKTVVFLPDTINKTESKETVKSK